MPVISTVVPKHNIVIPSVAYISFPSPAASVTVCFNQPVTNISSYLRALLMAELLASCFSLFHCGEGNCFILDLHCVPNQKVIGVFQKVFTIYHIMTRAARPTAPLDIVHGVSLLPCDGAL